MNTLHLTVLQPHSFALASPRIDDTREIYDWSHNYAAYRVVSLRWFDDASYARYQSDDSQEVVS